MQPPAKTLIEAGIDVRAAEDAMVMDALLEPARAAAALNVRVKFVDAEAPTDAGVAVTVPTEPDGVPIV